LKEIVRYTASKRLAISAMEKVKTRTSSVKPAEKFDKTDENAWKNKAQN
jgi:hypothetical protein